MIWPQITQITQIKEQKIKLLLADCELKSLTRKQRLMNVQSFDHRSIRQ
jgi:hypothetical protein